MKRWRPTAAIYLILVICAGTACAPPVPSECRAFVSCFAAEKSPYDDAAHYSYMRSISSDDGPGESLLQVKADLHQAYGAEGDCWLGSPEGWMWVACREACAGAIVEHCGLPIEQASGCRADLAEAPHFVAPNGDTLVCSEAEALQSTLQAEAAALAQTVGPAQ